MATPAITPPTQLPQEFKIIAAPFTPMKADGSLNLSVIEKYAEKLYDDGVAGVFVCGTTGEGPSLTVKERQQVAEAWRAVTGSRLKLIVHVGHCCTQDAIQLSSHAQKLDADGIASIGPLFFTPPTPEALVESLQPIAAAAPGVPFYAYHMPAMSRAPFPASSWMFEMSLRIPTFRGVKFTHEDMEDFSACTTIANGTFEMFFGRDELLLTGLRRGAKAAVGSTFNFAAPLYHRIAHAYANDQLAEATRLQSLCTRAIDRMVAAGGLAAIKSTLAMAGIDCGAPRLPLKAPTAERCNILRRELDEMGYFEEIAEQLPVAQQA
jgi:N-acetylneuraminate lyase